MTEDRELDADGAEVIDAGTAAKVEVDAKLDAAVAEDAEQAFSRSKEPSTGVSVDDTLDRSWNAIQSDQRSEAC